MIWRWLYIATEPAVEIYSGGAFPVSLLTAPLRLPRLIALDPVRGGARLGGGAEAPTAGATLANGDGALSRRWAVPPLGARAEVRAEIDGEVVVLAEGRVVAVECGAEARVEIES